MNEKSNTPLLLLAMVLGVIIGLMTAPHLSSSASSQNTLTENMAFVAEALENSYVDSLSTDTLSPLFLNSLLNTLDPHSYYLPPSDAKDHEERTRSSFFGIGLTLSLVDGHLYASEIFEDSPAQAAGIHPGDRILAVDDTPIDSTILFPDWHKVIDLIRGPRGTLTKLTIERGSQNKPLVVGIRRNAIFTPSVQAAFMMDKTMGYILIDSFTLTTDREFRQALQQLKAEGMQHLILDLRGNPGGSLAASLGVADELLPKGDLMVFTQGVHQLRKDYVASGGGAFEEGRLTVLIDELSASGSEVVAGALQDNDRGEIIGRRTFGKGLVQEGLEMPDGGMLFITTQRYYTPSGRCIQRPYNDGAEAYYTEHIINILTDINNIDTLPLHADSSQLFYTKKGRKVYGGGGILPDKVLPLQVDKQSEYIGLLARSRVLPDMATLYVHEHYDELIKKYPTIESFKRNYVVTPQQWQSLVDKAKAVDTANAFNIRQIKTIACNRFKGYIARCLYSGDAYYKFTLTDDPDIKKIIEK